MLNRIDLYCTTKDLNLQLFNHLAHIDFFGRPAYNGCMALDSKNRTRTGAAVSGIGIVCNILLAASKIAVGLIFGLVSVAADGFNNLSDCGSSAVALVSFKISEKPADKEHPYGHRRAEYVASMIIGFIVLFLAAELFRESIIKIIDGAEFSGTWVVFLVLGLSIAVKAGMFVFYRISAKKLQSDALRAAATDSLCDCIATAAVIIGALVSLYAGVSVDGWMGTVVALFVAVQGIRLLVEMGSKLLGQAPDEQLVKNIKEYLLSGCNVLGVHDLRVLGYGRDMYFATAHVEMDAGLPALEAHAVLDGLESGVLTEFGVNLTAHLDPVDLQDTEARRIEAEVKENLAGLEDGLEIHDLRLVRGLKTKIIFDACVPFSCKLSDGEIKKKISERLQFSENYELLITVDRA